MKQDIINYIKSKIPLIMVLTILMIVLLDDKSYVYIGPQDFKIEKTPSIKESSSNHRADNRLELDMPMDELNATSNYNFNGGLNDNRRHYNATE